MDLLVCSNDFPAGAVLMYGMGSTSAFKYCKACDADVRKGDPRKPFSFLRRIVHGNESGEGWTLRSKQSVQVCALAQNSLARDVVLTYDVLSCSHRTVSRKPKEHLQKQLEHRYCKTRG